MASTITLDSGPAGRGVAGDKFVRRGTGNLGVYATNGVAITPGQFELAKEISDLDVGTAGGYVLEFDKTNMKIKAYRQTAASSALIEVPNATDITASVFRFRAEGN